MTSRGTAVVLTGVLLLAVAAPQGAQQDPPRAVFRTDTRLVVQSVTVTDRAGEPIEGLRPADFVVTENGQPQAIAFVEFQRLTAGEHAPLPARADLDVTGAAAAIAVPAPGDARYRDRRLLVLYFDRASMPGHDERRTLVSARRFIDDRLEPADAIAIMVFDGGAVRVAQDFTDDRDALRAAVDRLLTGDIAGAADEVAQGTAFGEDDAEFSVFTTDRQLSALQTAVEMLAPLPERKALVYFGSGFRLTGADNRAQLRATINAAVRANVSINPIDARGLVALAPLGDATRASPGGLGAFTGSLVDAALARFQRSQDAFYGLAADTGGVALMDHGDLASGITAAASRLTSYYLVGYYSTHVEPDGRYRRVRVTLADGRRADVVSRDGYFADKVFARFTEADRERQLQEALRLENPLTELTLAVGVHYFRLNTAEYFVPVSVRIPGSEVAPAMRRGAPRTVIDLIGEVKDEHGITHRNVRDKLDIRLDAAQAAQLAARPLQYETGFTLLPGRYVIKVLARDGTTGRIGTFETPFEVPNLERRTPGRLAISSVVLSAQLVRPGDAVLRVRQRGTDASPLVHEGVRFVPTATRVFRADRDVHALVEIYAGMSEAPSSPIVWVAAFYRDGDKAFELSGHTAPPERPTSKGGARLTVPASSVEPGSYDFQLTLLSPDLQQAAFWRTSVVLR